MKQLFRRLGIMLIFSILTTFSYTTAHAAIKIAFVIQELSFRGIEVATFDYAHYNETLLGNESIIINFDTETDNAVRTKFTTRFPGKFFDCVSIEEMDMVLAQENVDILYFLKPGHNDGIVSRVCKNAVHAVFPTAEPHGDAYAFVSRWLTAQFPQLNAPYVPHIVQVADCDQDLRAELGIPADAIVFGRYGGQESFNVPAAVKAVKEVAAQRPDIYFLFMNTKQFCDLPNVIFVPQTTDAIYKAKFINTCDAMLHARWRGETFGLACGEFSLKNKPIITWLGSNERSHIDILGNAGIYYSGKDDLVDILLYFNKMPKVTGGIYANEFSPAAVMKKFNEVFIQPLIGNKNKKRVVTLASLQEYARTGDVTIIPNALCMSDSDLLATCRVLNESGHLVYIAGNVVLAFKTNTIVVDALIHAMTISRLYHFNSLCPDHVILHAEQTIGRMLSDVSVANIFDHMCSADARASLYYHVWAGLAFYERGDYRQSAAIFEELIAQGQTHWRILWYWAQALYKLSDKRVEQVVLTILRDYPQCAVAQKFKKLVSA